MNDARQRLQQNRRRGLHAQHAKLAAGALGYLAERAGAHNLTVEPDARAKHDRRGPAPSILFYEGRFLVATWWPGSGTLRIGATTRKAPDAGEALKQVAAALEGWHKEIGRIRHSFAPAGTVVRPARRGLLESAEWTDDGNETETATGAVDLVRQVEPGRRENATTDRAGGATQAGANPDRRSGGRRQGKSGGHGVVSVEAEREAKQQAENPDRFNELNDNCGGWWIWEGVTQPISGVKGSAADIQSVDRPT
jgi:hypothetical protein